MDVKIAQLLAELYAEQAYLEGMKALNSERRATNAALAYDEDAFIESAERMLDIAGRMMLR